MGRRLAVCGIIASRRFCTQQKGVAMIHVIASIERIGGAGRP
jgi:hypothetical protein